MPQKVDLAAVEAGCKLIDDAIELFNSVKSGIENATSLLNCNNLKFGDINSSLDVELDILKSHVQKCSQINDGVTSIIRANAQAQHEEYMAWLRSLEENKNKGGI